MASQSLDQRAPFAERTGATREDSRRGRFILPLLVKCRRAACFYEV